MDFSDVKGLLHAKRALEVAAAGVHHILLVGPPSSEKTALAERLPTILPDRTSGEPINSNHPFRSPPHTISENKIMDEVVLALDGVLFLGDLMAFKSYILEMIPQLLKSKSINGPAKPIVVGILKPCPCGFFTEPIKDCHCTPQQIQKYRSSISSRMVGLFDIQVDVPEVGDQEQPTGGSQESSADIRQRINAARAMQLRRFRETGIHANAQMGTREIKRYCVVKREGERLIEVAFNKLGLSPRAYLRILKVNRTIADLEGSEEIRPAHISEAIQYRSLDRRL